MLGSSSPAAASDHVDLGVWVGDPLDVTTNLDIYNIPIDSFFPDSQRPAGVLPMIPDEFDPATYGDSSILINHPEIHEQPNVPVTVPITLEEFGLRSFDPVVITSADGSVQQQWNLQITLSPSGTPPGSLTLIEDSSGAGGAFQIELPISPLLRFVSVPNGDVREFDFGAATPPVTFTLEGSGSWAKLCPDRLAVPGQTSNLCLGRDASGGTSQPFSLIDVTTPGGPAFNLRVEQTEAPPAPNRPPLLPQFGTQFVAEGQTLELPVNASDPDGHGIDLFAPNLVDFGEFNDNGDGTGAFLFSPGFDDNGSYIITIIATDDGSPPLSSGRTFILTVENTNRPPVLQPIGPLEGLEGATRTFNFSATDPDGDMLTFTIQGQPSYSQFVDNGDGTASLTVTAPFGSVLDLFDVTVTVTDSGSPPLSDQETFNLVILQGSGNAPPVLDPIDDITVREGESSELLGVFRATDANDDMISLSASLPFGCSLVPTTSMQGFEIAKLRCDPDVLPGRFVITVTATDERGASDSKSFTLTVLPRVDAGGPYTATQTDMTQLHGDCPSCVDDAGNVSFSWDLNNDGLFDDATGFSPLIDTTNLPIGDNPVVAQGCVPGTGVCNTDETTINVGAANQPPVLDASDLEEPIEIGELNPEVPISYVFVLTASDPDGHAVSFSATNLPDFGKLEDFGNGLAHLILTPLYGHSGVYSGITISVTDNGTPALSDTHTFAFTVLPFLDAGGNRTTTQGEPILLLPIASAGSTIEFDLNDDGVYETPGPATTIDTTPLAPGDYRVHVRACLNGVCSIQTFVITVLMPIPGDLPSFDSLRSLVAANVDNRAVRLVLLLILGLADLYDRLGAYIAAERTLETFIRTVQAFTPRWINPAASTLLVEAANDLIDFLYD
jgi:hypothetical protein